MTPRQLVALLFLISLGCNVDKVPLRSANDPMPSVDMGIEDAAAVVVQDSTTPAQDAGKADSEAMDTQVAPMDAALPTDTATPPVLDSGLSADSSTVDSSISDSAVIDALFIDEGVVDAAPPLECRGPVPQPGLMPAAIPDGTCMTCENAPRPTWRLYDFQDDSCGFEDTYGLDSFDGRATLVALFNAGCGYCQGQAQNLDRMHRELRTMGIDAYFVAVNGSRYEPYQDRIIDRCRLPFFQDTEEINAIEQMGGAIYDMFVYRPDGTLHVFLSGSGEIDTYLSVDEGYANVREAVISASRGEPYVPPNQDMDDQNDGGLGADAGLVD